MSLSGMDRLFEIDHVDQVVEPGLINSTLSAAVAQHGLSYPPDPSSWEMYLPVNLPVPALPSHGSAGIRQIRTSIPSAIT